MVDRENVMKPPARDGFRLSTFRHSGKLGDIIYSLPTVRALGGGIFYVDHRTEWQDKPPLGRETALMMVDLLTTQDYIVRASLYEGGPIDYDLDRSRSDPLYPLNIHCMFNSINNMANVFAGVFFGGHVKELRQRIVPQREMDFSQSYWEIVGLQGKVDVSKPWITGIRQKTIADIVVSRTDRYPGTLDWGHLREYAGRCVFVGLEEEWRAFSTAFFKIEFYRARDLLDIAQVIAGAKLYVGNQSFGLALADAMLTPRVAQLSDLSPNRMSPINGHCVLTPEILGVYLDR